MEKEKLDKGLVYLLCKSHFIDYALALKSNLQTKIFRVTVLTLS